MKYPALLLLCYTSTCLMAQLLPVNYGSDSSGATMVDAAASTSTSSGRGPTRRRLGMRLDLVDVWDDNSHNNNNNTNANNKTTAPTPVPSNTSKTNTTAPTAAPTGKNTTAPTPTPAPTNHTASPTVSPTTAKPSPTPAPHPTEAPTTLSPTSEGPTLAPTAEGGGVPAATSGVSLFRMMGKMMAWCILMGLGVLLYGFCIQHKYQIAYYLRHAGHFLVSVNQWLLHKIRPESNYSHNLHSRYAAMYASERNDAQSTALLFDAPTSQSLFDNTPSYDDSHGFVMGQHSNMHFQSMG